jgi:hypothetical protein
VPLQQINVLDAQMLNNILGGAVDDGKVVQRLCPILQPLLARPELSFFEFIVHKPVETTSSNLVFAKAYAAWGLPHSAELMPFVALY